MERSEREAIVRVLHAVAGADRRIGAKEERVLEAVSAKLGVAVVSDAIDISVEVTRITSARSRIATFEAAVAIATVDGPCTADERVRLDVTHKRMAAAETDFLHKMKDGPATGEYCALVADLHRVSVDALRDVLDSALDGRASYVDLDAALRREDG